MKMTNEEAMLREIFGDVCFEWLTEINAGAEERKEEGESKEDADPVRHGKWEVAGDTTNYYICSICGNPGDGFDNYCRSCGAKMERPCDKCQEGDCYGCDYKQTERSE